MTKRVAILGYSHRLPNSTGNSYWDNLLNEEDLITEVEAGRWSKEAFLHANKNHAGTSYTFKAGSIGDISGFDAGFFGIAPREAAQMDPQQRILLELSWEALENAGIKPSTIRGSQCGVYIGIASADYSYRLADDLAAIDSAVATGNTASIAANRLSYALDLRGPSMAIDTACSSSMVAFHQACQSILSGENSQALAGGISLHLHPYGFIIFSKASMLSKKGHCNVFDEAGDGYVRSEGGGIFVLKDYDLALADGDPIIAVVAHSGVNTDGKKNGLTVPSCSAQAELLKQTYAKAGIAASEIDYLEAHGTGTAVGDPIETRAIGLALGQHRSSESPLLIGSVKSNLGHLEAASGVAGLVKALHCIQYRLVPATIGIKKLNPKIKFAELNLKVVTQAQPLKTSGRLVIGVNSFGFGGANAHVILESAPQHAVSASATPAQALPIILSARSVAALPAAASNLNDYLAKTPDFNVYDLAYQLALRREQHPHQVMAFCQTPSEVSAFLSQVIEQSEQVLSGKAIAKAQGPVFVFSGNGSQWAGMGRSLLASNAVFQQAIAEVDAHFMPLSGYGLQDEIAGRNGQDDENRYAQTEIAQPALFAIQVGLVQMLRSQGITPSAVTGHSVGEVAAAWAAGALTLKDATAVIYHRSRMQGQTKGSGQMTAVAMGECEMNALLAECGLNIAIAGVNSARGITLAGEVNALSQIEAQLAARNIRFKRLDLDYAFHSAKMDPIENDLIAALSDIKPQLNSIAFYSTVTGELLSGEQLNAQYWWHNIRQPVLFENAINAINQSGANVFLEVGPHSVLRSYILETLKNNACEGLVLGTLSKTEHGENKVFSAMASIIASGCEIDWATQFPTPGQFMQLPNYPWQRERLWINSSTESLGQLSRDMLHPLLGYALKQHASSWENQLDTIKNPVLADHIVGDAVVFPGTGYVELALAAAIQQNDGALIEIEELEILAPLVLSESPAKLVRTQVSNHQVQISARDYTGEDRWTIHAKAKIKPEPNAILLANSQIVLPQTAIDFNGASHQALTQAAGLDYGAAFLCIEHGWIKGNQVIAKLQYPSEIQAELADYHLHPALLDCTFQLIIQLLQDEMAALSGVAFVPTKIGRIAFASNPNPPALAQLTLIQRAPHSLTADFIICDAAGEVIVTIKEARFRSVRLRKTQHDALHLLHYRQQAAPLAAQQLPQLPANALAASLQQHVASLSEQAEFNRYLNEVEPLLDSLASHSNIELLGELDAANNSERYLNCLAIAAKDQLIERHGDQWQRSANSDDGISANAIWQVLVSEYSAYFHSIHAIGLAKIRHQADFDPSAAQPQLAASDYPSLWRAALGGQRQQALAKHIADLLAKHAAMLDIGQRLSILEVAAGAPIFAQEAASQLDLTLCDYGFATPSDDTLAELAQWRQQLPDLRIEKIPAIEQIERSVPHGVDLAIVSLDFSDVSSAKAAIAYASAQLAPQGKLLLIGRHRSQWLDFICADLAQPLENPSEYWASHLSQQGYCCAELIEAAPDRYTDLFFQIATLDQPAPMLATAGDITPCLILIDPSQIDDAAHKLWRAQLQQQLSAQGINAELHQANSDQPLNAVLSQLFSAQRGHIILHPGYRPASDSLSVLAQQTQRCGQLAQLLNAVEQSQCAADCWIITHGASDHADATQQRADSALWGFARTLLNEASDAAFHLIDFANNNSAIQTAALAREIAAKSPEQEVMIDANGARFVPRLQLVQAAHSEKSAANDGEIIQLGFEFPGQLRNLRWAATTPAPLAADQIDIDVVATGLNFRDVMYALGLLSDEAVENGFAGPTLGLEFAGVVRQVGADVVGYQVGDEVVGFGPSSFANRVRTQSSAIAKIPAGISFAAAATIPSVFFTVYYALQHLARLEPGEKILIHGAAGGVGIAAIQLAKHLGAEIYATAGSDEKRAFLQQMGVQHIYDSRSLSYADEILRDTADLGVDVVLNSLAGEAINRNFSVLKPFGRFLELGKRDFYENSKIGLRPFRNNISYFGIDADQMMQVRPALTQRLFTEVMALFSEGVLSPLPYQVFDAEQIVDAFRHMQQAKQIGKIVVTYSHGLMAQHAAPQPAALQLSAEGSYLVTGGLAGFGLKTAQWLADKGAKNLVLISRSGPSAPEAQAAIAALRLRGVKVLPLACDVTQLAELAQVFAHFGQTMPPLKGIVHAAVVIDDALIRNTEPAQINKVLAPKMLGADYLHQLSAPLDLDFLVLYSSATTIFGNPGQASYVAANHYMEALAEQRRAQGLPATSVCWGAIDDVGFLARNEKIKDALQNRMGGKALSSDQALNYLEQMLIEQSSGLSVLELDWPALARFLPSAKTPKFSAIARRMQSNDQGTDQASDIQSLIDTLSDTELHATFVSMLKQEVAQILRVNADKIDASGSLYDIGLDSLMGVELVVALEERFGTRLPVMALSESPTINKLADRLILQLKHHETVSDDATLAQVQHLSAVHGASSETDSHALASQISQQSTTRIIQ
ncbi:type I polyketide synthase [Deefgea salmonis]|uniref:Type I polyketide synthase n=1 Tax=Deefgea salmonis TaxID=2875502 RepID=A0ABS8BNP6_9NEIS|nr:type I polyketide synthase [Deefgea salmonis]MCB5197363.1 type I polyketide synthase [Deefgea salmonis]